VGEVAVFQNEVDSIVWCDSTGCTVKSIHHLTRDEHGTVNRDTSGM